MRDIIIGLTAFPDDKRVNLGKNVSGNLHKTIIKASGKCTSTRIINEARILRNAAIKAYKI